MSAFGDLLRSCRHKSRDPQSGRPLTQERLAELLSIEAGVEGYSGGTVSNWERGVNQIRRDDRHILVGLIKTLYQGGGIKTPAEAQTLLLAGNYRPLDEIELSQINPAWKHAQTGIALEDGFPSAAEQAAALPAPTYSRLFGVEATIDHILTLLTASRSPHLILVVGLGGIGKTAVADAVVRRAIQQVAFTQVIWLTVESLREEGNDKAPTHTMLAAVVNALAERILPDGRHDANPQRRLARVRSKLKNTRYLIIIDNLEDPDEMNQLLAHLNTLANPSKFLITARRFPAPDSEVYALVMEELAQSDAIKMLKYQAETGGVNAFQQINEEDLFAIYQIVGGHPLALRLITRLARIYPLPQIMTEWQKGGRGYINQVYQSIYEAFWKMLEPAEKQLLLAMPVAAQTGLTPEHLQFVSQLSGETFWPALTKLVEICLIEPRGSLQARRYGVHSLTAHYLYASHSPLAEVIQAHIAYWQQHLDQLPENQWHTLDAERANIWQAIQFSLALPTEQITPQLREHLLQLSESLFRFVELRGYANEWLPLLENLIALFEEDSRAKVKLLFRLGELYRLTYQLPEAITTHQDAMRIATHIADDFQTARAHYYLGLAHYHSQQYGVAEEHGQTALALFQKTGHTERESASTLNLLGTIAFAQERFDLSATYLNQAADLWRKINRVPELARTLNNLARTLQQQEKIEDAFSCYAEAGQALTQTTSELDRALIYLSEGTLHFELGQLSNAEKSFSRIDLSYLAEAGHLLYQALTLNNLGQVTLKQGNYGKAESLFQSSIMIWRKIDNAVELANALNGLGKVYKAQRKQEMAKIAFKEVVSLTNAYLDNNRAVQLHKEASYSMNRL